MKETMKRYSGKMTRYTEFICNRCGIKSERMSSIEQLKTKHRYGKGNKCTDCSVVLAKRTKRHKGRLSFLRRIREKYPNVGLNIAYKTYRGSGVKVQIKCPIHGLEWKRPSDYLLSNHQCTKCAIEDRKDTGRTTTVEHFNNLLPAHVKVADDSDYGYKRTMDLTCKYHGRFTVKGSNIKQGVMICKKCRKLIHSRQTIRKNLIGTDTSLYYVYIKEIDMYKVGMTVDILRRYTDLGTVTEILRYTLSYLDAIEIEHRICMELSEYRYHGSKKLVRHGNTELFKTDVEERIKELTKCFMREISCRKSSNSGEAVASNVDGNPERSLDELKEERQNKRKPRRKSTTKDKWISERKGRFYVCIRRVGVRAINKAFTTLDEARLFRDSMI